MWSTIYAFQEMQRYANESARIDYLNRQVALYNSGLGNFEKKYYQWAINNFNEAIGNNADVNLSEKAKVMNLACYFELKNYQFIINNYQSIDDGYLDNELKARKYIVVARAIKEIGDLDRAFSLIQYGLKQCAQKENLYFWQGQFYFDQKKYHQAKRAYKQARLINPNEGLYYFNRGTCYHSMVSQQTNEKYIHKAIGEYRLAISYNHNVSECKKRIAELENSLKELQQNKEKEQRRLRQLEEERQRQIREEELQKQREREREEACVQQAVNLCQEIEQFLKSPTKDTFGFTIDNYIKKLSPFIDSFNHPELYRLRAKLYHQKTKISAHTFISYRLSKMKKDDDGSTDYLKAERNFINYSRLPIKFDNVAFFVERARFYQAKNEWLLALKDIEKALNLQSYNSDALAAKKDILKLKTNNDVGLAEFKLGDFKIPLFLKSIDFSTIYDSFIKFYNEQIEQSPKQDNYRFDRGLVYYYNAKKSSDLLQKISSCEKAIKDFQKCLSMSPTKTQYSAKLRKANQLLEGLNEQQFREAQNAITQKESEAKAQAIVLFNKAQECGNEGKPDEEIRLYTQAIEIYPGGYAKAYNNRGIVYKNKAEYSLALSDLNRAIEIEPNPRRYLNRGKVYYLRNEYDNALADYREALNLDPSFQEAIEAKRRLEDYIRDNMNSKLRGLKRTWSSKPEKEIISEYQKYQNEFSLFPESTIALGKYYLYLAWKTVNKATKDNYIRMAKLLFQKVLDINASNEKAKLTLKKAGWADADYANQIKLYGAAFNKSSDQASSLIEVGSYQYYVAKYSSSPDLLFKAKKSFETALMIDSSNKQAKEGLEKVLRKI